MFQIRDELRDGVREQLLTNTFQQAKLQTVKVTPSEVRAWFNEFPTDSLPTLPEIVRVAHIVKLPELNPEAKQEAMDLITTIRDSIIQTDATIEELAKFSDDPGSAQQGGRISNIKLSELVPEFGAIASRLEPGTLSEPFETSFGLHIMRLNSRVGDVIDFNHILIQIDDSKVNLEPARKALVHLRDSLINNSIPFERMAKAHSDEPRSAAQGGFVTDPQSGERDLVLEALGPSWQSTLRNLKQGEISEPEETELLDGRKAMHIVMLQKRVPEHVVNLSTDYERIEQLVTQEKRGRMRQQWLQQLRKDVYIKMLVDVPDSTLEAAKNL
jgi:peptidyl-prolyl cis-trans isomerase SurA